MYSKDVSYRAIVIGAPGAVGGALDRELVASPACDGVVALVRRQVDGLRASDKKVKGAAERAVEQAGVARTSLFRPSLLVTPDIRYGLQDRVTQLFFPLIQPILPRRYHSVRVEDLGRAMRLNAERPGPAGIEVLQYPEFARLLPTGNRGSGA